MLSRTVTNHIAAKAHKYKSANIIDSKNLIVARQQIFKRI